MEDKYRFGIVGCGTVAYHHADSIAATENAELVAVCDIKEEKARSFAEEYGVEKYYTDYQEMLKDDEIDVISVCTISGLHADNSIDAAKAGKHILCEKPIALNKKDLDKIEAEVKKNNVKMQCVFQTRIKPEYQAVKEALTNNVFGKTILADAVLKFYRSQEYYDSADWRGTWEFDGGGSLMNQGIHGIDILLWLAGDVESVFGRSAALVRDIEVEDTAVAVVKYKNGAFGTIEATTSVYPGQERRFAIHGEKGSVIFTENGIVEWAIEGEEDVQPPQFETKKEDTSQDPTKFSRTSHVPMVKDLIEAIDKDKNPSIPPAEGRKAIDLILAIYESSKTGKEVLV
jgi:predicted dehydrogenase